MIDVIMNLKLVCLTDLAQQNMNIIWSALKDNLTLTDHEALSDLSKIRLYLSKE